MVKQAEKKKPARYSILPAMGLVLAITYGVIAFFLGPILFDLAIENSADFAQSVGDTEPRYIEIGISAVVWLLMLVLSMFIVSAAIGEDPEEEMRMIKPRADDPKAVKRYIQYQEKLAKTRRQQIEELKKKQAKEEAKQKKSK